MEKYFSDNSLLKLQPTKPPLTMSKTVSFSLKNLEEPSKDDLSPNHLVTRLKYPNIFRKFLVKEKLVFDDNQLKTTESLYHNKKFRLHEQRTLKTIHNSLLQQHVKSLFSFSLAEYTLA